MDISSGVEKEKYLFCFGPPFKSMCKVLSLKSGVLIIAIFDIIFGVYHFINLMLQLWWLLPWGLSFTLTYVLIFQSVLGVAAVFYAIKHIRASPNDFAVYSYFKTFELIAQGLLKFALIFFFTEYCVQVYREFHILYVAYIIIERLFTILFAKVVWSANIRSKYNEIALVQQGEETARKVQIESNTIVAPKIVFSGMGPYFPGP